MLSLILCILLEITIRRSIFLLQCNFPPSCPSLLKQTKAFNIKMTSMQNTQNGRGKKSDKTGQPLFPRARLSTTKDWGSNPSTGPIVHVAVSLAKDQKSIDGETSFKDAEYNIIDRGYERAKDDTAETLAEARSRPYWKRVWNQAVWRPIKSIPNLETVEAKDYRRLHLSHREHQNMS